MELSNSGEIRRILNKYGFTFSKALGQNFIINPYVCPKMAELGNAVPGFGVLEIGPGIGVLTKELALRADRVVAVELDNRLLPVLDETLSEFDNVRIVHGDALKIDLHELIETEFPGMPVAVCANLPYYITSPVIMHLLESRLPIQSITVMVQKEAAARICATPGSRDVGAVSLAVRYFSNPKILFGVSRGSFMPAPDLDSAVIRLDVLETPSVTVDDEAAFFKVIRGAFSQRRKTLLNSLSASYPLEKPQLTALLAQLDIPLNSRPEQLSLQQFADIANGLSAKA